jgi:hypothetical protein
MCGWVLLVRGKPNDIWSKFLTYKNNFFQISTSRNFSVSFLEHVFFNVSWDNFVSTVLLSKLTWNIRSRQLKFSTNDIPQLSSLCPFVIWFTGRRQWLILSITLSFRNGNHHASSDNRPFDVYQSHFVKSKPDALDRAPFLYVFTFYSFYKSLWEKVDSFDLTK